MRCLHRFNLDIMWGAYIDLTSTFERSSLAEAASLALCASNLDFNAKHLATSISLFPETSSLWFRSNVFKLTTVVLHKFSTEMSSMIADASILSITTIQCQPRSDIINIRIDTILWPEKIIVKLVLNFMIRRMKFTDKTISNSITQR